MACGDGGKKIFETADDHLAFLSRLDDLSPIIQQTGNYTRELLDERRAAIEALDTALEAFTWERGRHTGTHAEDVRRANHANRALLPRIEPE